MENVFTDPVLAAPTIGCMLMCFVAAIVGTFSVLRHQSLVGEMLSHACYPGVILSLLALEIFLPTASDTVALLVPLLGSTVSCILGMYFVDLLQRRFHVTADSALCVTLASFFGIGLTLLTALQMAYPTLYSQLQNYLFGQAATMTQINVVIYAILAIGVVLLLLIFYRPIKVVIFDPQFATAVGINKGQVYFLLLTIIVLAVVIGIRSVGVVLMSAMLIFPAATARQWTDRLSSLLIAASLFGLFCGLFGVYLSHQMSFLWIREGKVVSFPTGPMIVLIASCLFFFSSLFAPKRGLCVQVFRRIRFWNKCQEENLLKMIWKQCSIDKRQTIEFKEIEGVFHTSSMLLKLLLFSLQRKGLLRKMGRETYQLTASGQLWGRKIVRLHRLWEVYLVEYCGIAKDRVHPSAEEMEHIITPEIEKELSCLLHNPVQDPHQQPIPVI